MFRGFSVGVAQPVELWIVDPAVAGSNPVAHPPEMQALAAYPFRATFAGPAFLRFLLRNRSLRDPRRPSSATLRDAMADDTSEINTEVFRTVPSALLVGVADEHLERCTAALVPLRIVRVDEPLLAFERIVRSRPFVIVVGHTRASLKASELEELRARARDVSAQVVEIAPGVRPARLTLELRAALRAAETSREWDDEIEVDLEDANHDTVSGTGAGGRPAGPRGRT